MILDRFDDIVRAVECLLFVSAGPVNCKEMAAAMEVDEDLVQQAAQELANRKPSQSGLRVEAVAGGWQMVTRPEYGIAVAKFVGKRAQKLSRAALEVLAIIAYNQPCTQPEMEAIRGVDSSGVLKSLLDRGLIRELGRKEAPGRPILYGVTDEFLVYFGLNSLEDLPDQSTLEALALTAEDLGFRAESAGQEEPAGQESGQEEANPEEASPVCTDENAEAPVA